jgi:hypothetical protein
MGRERRQQASSRDSIQDQQPLLPSRKLIGHLQSQGLQISRHDVTTKAPKETLTLALGLDAPCPRVAKLEQSCSSADGIRSDLGLRKQRDKGVFKGGLT